ncbi:MAG: alpha/beta hydrolase [Pseudorhodobacter sp.]|nr:alpha/beta hydrolase [Pseudorhodobacter sp.]
MASRRAAKLLGVFVCLILGSCPVSAQVAGLQDPTFSQLNALVAKEPAAALLEIQTILAQPETAANPRLVIDLNRLAADLLIDQGRHAEAGKLLEQIGQFAARNRERLDTDPIPVWRKAVAQYEAAGDPQAALRVQAVLVQDLRDAGLNGSALSEALIKMSDLARATGNAEAAAQLAAAAETALQPFIDEGGARGAGEGFSRVEVFYATDRARSGDSYPGDFYGYGRGPLDYGTLQVTVPDSHVPGAIESPSVWRLEFGPTASKHIILRSITPVPKDAFFAKMQDSVASRPHKEVFVFIHGYNVSFEAAALRAAQLTHDMNYSGVPVLYSWPSQGSTLGYIADTAVVQLSARHLTLFLEDIVAQSGATTINIVAHSMGNRALTEALELMALRDGQRDGMKPPFDQVIFAAPDVDAGLFAAMIPTIRPLARRLTLYASENDWALITSRQLHGDAPRAGQGGADTLALPTIDSVDMSELGDDMLAHSYFASDSSALVDLVALFWQNLPPEKRCGLERVAANGALAVWRYVRNTCPENAVLAVIDTLRQEGRSSPADARRIVAQVVPDPVMAKTVEPFVMRMLTP